MKSTLLSLFALVALAGVQAASVEGNNVALVIRRANVASASGHQLICVPVRPFDITGQKATQGGIVLEDLLPAALYKSATVTRNSGTMSAVTYQSDGTSWKIENEDAGTVTLNPREVLWLFNPQDKQELALNAASEGEPVVFCGEENVEQAPITANGQMQSIGNATASEVSLATLLRARTFNEGDQVSRIAKRHHKNYTVYLYSDGVWLTLHNDGGIDIADLNTIMIAPGEAVYYYLSPESVENAQGK